MNWTTPIDIPVSARPITHDNRLLFLGSCFADNIGERFHIAGFNTTINPFGTLYNPASIATCINLLSTDQPFDNQRYTVQHDNYYHSFMHHSRFSSSDPLQYQQRIQDSLTQGRQALRQSDVVIITFGTAYCYLYHNMVVSNCHKLPAANFTRKRLTVSEILQLFNPIFSTPLWQQKHIILTVSPIRHRKDGLHENQLSKATLLLAIDQLCLTFPNIDYFPSYEILLDELRDYRFYAEDLCHPNTQAVSYIYERFQQTYFTPPTLQKARDAEKAYKTFQHRTILQ